MNRVYASLPPTIFDVMSTLARDLGAINLGQGFPEEDGPLELRQAAAAALLEQSNQYPPMRGLPETRAAVAAHYNRFHGLDLDWAREVTITSGATEAIAAALLATLDEGDECVLIEPYYDAYAPLVRRAGATPRFLRLEPPHWRIREEALAAAFTERTRAIVVNTPVNPAARVMDAEDIALIAKYCVRHDALAIADEVWEHVTFDGRAHRTLLAHPDLRARTIKIGSAGKMFQMTGWKVGFVCAVPALTEQVVKAHQFLTFTTPPNLQRAAAHGLAKDENYFMALRAELQRSRDRLVNALNAEGFAMSPCEGTYFLNVDLAASGISLPDQEFAVRAVKEAGVAVIPLSAFYAQNAPQSLVRLCFAKRDVTLDAGAERLAKMRRTLA
jgi:aspartate/methionine/tyrosine aminotransferase